MKTYEIINPSDPYTISAADEMVACVATLMLGEGRYALKHQNGSSVMPIFFFSDPIPWLKERGVDDLSGYIEANYSRLADCMATVKCGREKTSLNDIGAHATQWAEALREKAAEKTR